MIKTFRVGKNIKKKIHLTEGGEYVVELVGEGAVVNIVGGWKLGGEEKVKVLLTIIHKARHTKANTLLKAVVGDDSSIDIFGKIIVEKDAQQTESFLKEAVLITSDMARAKAVPDLEILANEVKCSHAASISKIDDQQIYYLMSRGITKEEAREIIVEGFLEEVGLGEVGIENDKIT